MVFSSAPLIACRPLSPCFTLFAVNLFDTQYVFQTYHPLCLENYPLPSTKILNPAAAAIDIPQPISAFYPSHPDLATHGQVHRWDRLSSDENFRNLGR